MAPSITVTTREGITAFYRLTTTPTSQLSPPLPDRTSRPELAASTRTTWLCNGVPRRLRYRLRLRLQPRREPQLHRRLRRQRRRVPPPSPRRRLLRPHRCRRQM